jgi:RimJ/RimL family protein N-acetyltransferase
MLPFVAIQQYGLSLHQMRDADIEIVREGRNQPFVRKNHFFQETIAPEQHRSWYDGICKTSDYYMVVCKDGDPLGLISLKKITPGMHTGELGIFFWKKPVLRTRLPILAIITFLDFFLFTVGTQNIEAIIRIDNAPMAHIFEFLNFDRYYDTARQFLKTSSTRIQYSKNHTRLMDFARRLSKDPVSWKLRIEGDRDSRHHPEMLRVIP